MASPVNPLARCVLAQSASRPDRSKTRNSRSGPGKKLEANAGVRLTAAQEPGAFGVIGPSAGKPLPFGSGELASTRDPAFLDAPDEEFFNRAEALVRAAPGAGAEDIVLHVDVEHDGQCNLEFSQAFLAAVQRLGVPFTMTCYEAGGREVT